MKILEKTYKAYLKFQVSGKKKIKIMMKAFVIRMAGAFFVPLLWDLGGVRQFGAKYITGGNPVW